MALSEEDRKRIEEEERVRAEARIRAEIEARRKIEAEGKAKEAEEKRREEEYKRKQNRRVVLVLAGMVGFVLLIVGFGMLIDIPSEPQRSGQPQKPPQWEPGSDIGGQWVVENLIEEWKRGDSGGRYWKDGVLLIDRTALFAVREYKHLAQGGWKEADGSWKPGREWHRYRIKSSTQGGFAIEKLWRFEVEKVGNEWKVTRVLEDYPFP